MNYFLSRQCCDGKNKHIYVYLGALTTNQVLSAQVKEHATMKAGHVIKFSSFLQKN